MPIAGRGATLSGTTYTAALDIVEISGGSESIEALDISTLGQTTTFMRYQVGDMADTPEISVTINWTNTNPPAIGAKDTWTLTFPKDGTATTARSLSGTGFVTEKGYPTFVNNQISQGTLTIKLDGATGPAYT
jgi:hypothetical protein